jgi:hypothetical protein
MRIVDRAIALAGSDANYWERCSGAKTTTADMRALRAASAALLADGLDDAAIAGFVGRETNTMRYALKCYRQDLGAHRVASELAAEFGIDLAVVRVKRRQGRAPTHGTKAAYYNRRCRCEACVAWHASQGYGSNRGIRSADTKEMYGI